MPTKAMEELTDEQSTKATNNNNEKKQLFVGPANSFRANLESADSDLGTTLKAQFESFIQFLCDNFAVLNKDSFEDVPLLTNSVDSHATAGQQCKG